MTVLLETRNVSKAYGAFRALDGVSMTVASGELLAVVGPNGAGKTTLVNLLTGLMTPSAGEVLFMGASIAGVGPVRLAERGLARAFQLIQIFPQLTVAETIAAAVISRQKKRWHLFARLSADREIAARRRHRRDIRPASPARYGQRGTVPGREEAARRRVGLRARPASHPARRADLRRLHRRQARHHEDPDRGRRKAPA